MKYRQTGKKETLKSVLSIGQDRTRARQSLAERYARLRSGASFTAEAEETLRKQQLAE